MDEVEQKVRDKLAEEVEALEQRLSDVREKLPALDAAYQQAWDAYAKSGDATGEAADAVAAEADSTARAFHGAFDEERFVLKQLDKLRSGEELEARLTKRQKLEGVRMAAKKNIEPTPCECGCGALSKGRYLPGHDARHKSALVTAAKAGDADAKATLKRLNWTKFLTKSLETDKVREAKATAAAEKKAADVRRRTEEKKAKAAAKVAARADAKANKAKLEEVATQNGDEPQVVPDPKPEKAARKPRARRQSSRGPKDLSDRVSF